MSTVLDRYVNKPETAATTSATPRAKLRRMAVAAAKRGELFKPCSWCFGATPELNDLDNISHTVCEAHFAELMTGGLR